jgi:hypothetical protein
VCGGLGLALKRARQDPLDLLVAQLAWRAWARFIEQTVQAEVDESLPPLAGRRQPTSLLAGDLGVA